MSEILELLIIAVVAVTGFTVIYKLLPFRDFGPGKPGFVLFPKYSAPFEKPVNDIERSLKALNFEKKEHGKYSRGKIYGDFSAKAIKLTVDIQEKDKVVKVYASVFGILFDTGDIWQVTSDILKGTEL